jgi:hypothetical protein
MVYLGMFLLILFQMKMQKKDAALRKEQRTRIHKTFWLDADFDDKKYDDFYSKYKFSS